MKINEDDYESVIPSTNWMKDFLLSKFSWYDRVPAEYANWAAIYLGTMSRFRPEGGRASVAEVLLNQACEKYIKENNL